MTSSHLHLAQVMWAVIQVHWGCGPPHSAGPGPEAPSTNNDLGTGANWFYSVLKFMVVTLALSSKAISVLTSLSYLPPPLGTVFLNAVLLLVGVGSVLAFKANSGEEALSRGTGVKVEAMGLFPVLGFTESGLVLDLKSNFLSLSFSNGSCLFPCCTA